MPRWGMVIDLDRCTGCRACETACAMENNIPTASDDQLAMGRGITWMKVLTHVSGEFPPQRNYFGRLLYCVRPSLHLVPSAQSPILQ